MIGVDLTTARVAAEDVAAHHGRAARDDVADDAAMARKNGARELCEVVVTMGREDVGEFGHAATDRP
jgi:hypothetical protein